MKTSENIITYLQEKLQATAKELSDHFGLTSRAIFKQLKKLQEKGQITKIGIPPTVFYLPAKASKKVETPKLDQKTITILQKDYLYIRPTGEIEEGVKGFVAWCNNHALDIEKTAREYLRSKKKYDSFREKGLIDDMEKMRNTFVETFLDELYYLDFYSIERFGKTKLGQLLLYAKQSQNKQLIQSLAERIKPSLEKIISKKQIDGIGFIPPTVKREVQLIKELERILSLPVRRLSITKIKSPIMVPQKTLSRLSDRVENARKTIVVAENGRYANILLMDDAVGSGATLNETAAQIHRKKICSGKIIGLAITGSFKGFDVISEV